jgi:nucleoside-diphosphate-sugar epimerase
VHSIAKTVIVAGAQGVIGRAAAVRFADLGWEVIGVSRRAPAEDLPVRQLSVDLLDRADTEAKLRELTHATHLVFAAYVERPTASEAVVPNVTMLRNALDVLEAVAPNLQHVTLYQGGKAYGAHLGAFKTPAREDDPRHMPPNFYYAQEDLLRARQPGKAWHWTALRPEAVCGYALGNPMNLAMVIAVYATICKELGLPLRFPGTRAAYDALYQVTSAEILARATAWAATSRAAHEQIFNITNGDYFRWRHLWPAIARAFAIPVADPLRIPLVEYMADKEPLWERIAAREGLRPIPYEQLASWGFGDAIFGMDFDNITSTIKARRAGFPDCIDTEEMFVEFFEDLRRRRVIPALR